MRKVQVSLNMGGIQCLRNATWRKFLLEKLMVAYLLKYFPSFVGPKHSTINGHYPDLDNPAYILIAYFLKVHFNIYV
jgi:hypothetical protein